MLSFRLGRFVIEFSFFFVAVLTAIFIFDNGYNALWSMAAIALHETAHIVALLLLGGRPKWLRMTLCELNICADSNTLSPAGLFAVAMAGPLTNIVLGLLLLPVAAEFAKVNLILGLFQLLPVTTLDGDQALSALSERGRVRTAISLVICFLTALLGFYLLLQSRYNFSILAVSLYLIFITLHEWRRCNVV